MEEVLVRVWDDRIKGERGERVEAAERLVIEHRGRRYRIDLTAENARLLDADLEPWLAVATRLPREGEDSPAMPHGFLPGSSEARKWRAGLRAWAADQGRGGEVHEHRTGRKVNYTYAYALERDYQNHLMERTAGIMLSQVS
jgi:hypothetical protein